MQLTGIDLQYRGSDYYSQTLYTRRLSPRPPDARRFSRIIKFTPLRIPPNYRHYSPPLLYERHSDPWLGRGL